MDFFVHTSQLFFISPAAVHMASPVASHTCTFKTYFGNEIFSIAKNSIFPLLLVFRYFFNTIFPLDGYFSTSEVLISTSEVLIRCPEVLISTSEVLI